MKAIKEELRRPRVRDILHIGAKQIWSAPCVDDHQRHVLSSIFQCRTPALGGRVLVCPSCRKEKTVFHSCRNRHCPCCQANAQQQWIDARAQSMLAVPHYHVTFTLPSELRDLCRDFPRELYNLLLKSCGEVLIKLGKETLRAQLGVTTILHTWSRDLYYHVHAHCLVSAGGWDSEEAVFRTPKRRNYLFPGARLKAMFRARFLRGLRMLVQQGSVTLAGKLTWKQFERSLPEKKKWVVHLQAPKGGFEHALSYLGRYTRRVAISDNRLRHVTDTHVTFKTREAKTCTLTHKEFTRRFLMHVLPVGFKKVRHYGLYASGSKHRCLAQAFMANQPVEITLSCSDEGTEPCLTTQPPPKRRPCCPDCNSQLYILCDIPPRASPCMF